MWKNDEEAQLIIVVWPRATTGYWSGKTLCLCASLTVAGIKRGHALSGGLGTTTTYGRLNNTQQTLQSVAVAVVPSFNWRLFLC